jgi:hypothetical protein
VGYDRTVLNRSAPGERDDTTMLQNQPRTTSLFRNSLRSWQANYKAQQTAQPAEPPAAVEAVAPPGQPARPRVKRLVARRRRRAVAAQG